MPSRRARIRILNTIKGEQHMGAIVTIISGRIPGSEMIIIAFAVGYHTEKSDDIKYPVDLKKGEGIDIARA